MREKIDSFIARPVVMPTAISTTDSVQYWASDFTDSRLSCAIARRINAEFRRREHQRPGVNTQQIRTVQPTWLPLDQLDPRADAGEETTSVADTLCQFSPIGLVYLTFIPLMQSVQYLLSNTV